MWSGSRAGFEVGRKYLNSRGVPPRGVANTPGETPRPGRVEFLSAMHVGTQVHDSLSVKSSLHLDALYRFRPNRAERSRELVKPVSRSKGMHAQHFGKLGARGQRR